MADGSDQSLKIQIIIDLLNQGKIGEAKAEIQGLVATTGDLSTGTGAASSAAAESTKTTGELGEATKGLDFKKRELLESMRLVTGQFPLLGEAARTFYNPTTAAIFGIIAAFALFENRIKETAESLGELELPDLSDAVRQAQDGATAWDAMAKAVRDADDAFNSVADTEERSLKAIEQQISAQKRLLDAQKALAEAKLDQDKATGKISQGQYDVSKAALDEGYNDKTYDLEIEAQKKTLAAKEKAGKDFQTEANKYNSQADAVTKKYGLGQTDDEFSAQKKALQDIADARQKSLDQARANMALLNEADSPDTGAVKGAADWAKLIGHYGLGVTTPGGFKSALGMEQTNINDQEAQQKQLEQQIALLEKQKELRDELRSKAAESQGKAEKAKDELPGLLAEANQAIAELRQEKQLKDETIETQNATKIAEQAQKDGGAIRKFNSQPSVSSADAQKAAQNASDLTDLLKEHTAAINKIANLPVGQIRADLNKAMEKLNSLSNQTKSMATSQ